MDQQKKLAQQEELRRVYQQQIAEKEQRRQEELRRKLLEEREEAERIRNKKELEMRWMAEEYNRRLAQEELARRLMEENQARERARFMQTVPTTQRITTPAPMTPIKEPEEEMEEKVQEEISKVDEEAEKERRMRELKSEVYGVMTKQVQNVIQSEMGKLKNQMDIHNKILKDQILTLKVF